jgi:hypothetical protein
MKKKLLQSEPATIPDIDLDDTCLKSKFFAGLTEDTQSLIQMDYKKNKKSGNNYKSLLLKPLKDRTVNERTELLYLVENIPFFKQSNLSKGELFEISNTLQFMPVT